MTLRLFLFVSVLIGSTLNNLLIPFFIYYQKYGFFRKRNKDFIGCNGWGIVMDGILAGLINIIAFNLIYDLKFPVNHDDIKLALLLGFFTMVATHIFMSVKSWKIWIMPSPWQFNIAGYWHMVSMTLQMAFLYYPLIIIGENPALLQKSITLISLITSIFLSFLFLLSLRLSRRGIKIWRIHLSHEPW